MMRNPVLPSAGRTAMTDEMQALCLFAGANSISSRHAADAGNPGEDHDAALFRAWYKRWNSASYEGRRGG